MKIRKITAAAMSACIFISAAPSVSFAENKEILENCGFEWLSEAQEPYWWSSTAGEESLGNPALKTKISNISYAGSNSLYISDRSSAASGVMQRYDKTKLIPGAEYEARAFVKYTGDNSPKSIEFSLMFGNNYGWNSVKMASETVKKDRWTEIKGYFTASEEIGDGYVYTITNETDSFADYYIDNFSITSDPYVVEDGDFIENSTFDESSAPWFGFGGGELTVSDGALKSGGRTAAWVGPGQSLSKKMRSGHRYKISADVKYGTETGVRAGINCTLVHETGTNGDAVNYTTLMTSTVDSGEWYHAENIVTLPEDIKDKQTIYFGTASDEQKSDIYIDNVSIIEVEDDGTLAKTVGNSNPLMSHSFGADPYAMEYDGRLYIYMSSDKFEYDGDGNLVTNTFAELKAIKVISTDDMVNWVDHGEIPVGATESFSYNDDGSYKTYYDGLQNGGAKWAGLSWAPAVAHKNINGQEKFFLYFANAGGGIGVLEGDSPIGPFHDPTVDEAHPYGTSIVDIWQEIPGTEKVITYYDPAVLVDDDGQGYLYFGGGFTDDYNHPESVCVIKLSDDMTSVVGDAVAIDAPGLFEDSGIHKYNGKYYYSYSSNFENEKGMDVVEPGVIYYLVSDSPMGPFKSPVEGEAAGKILDNMYLFFKTGGNNHHAIFPFKDRWYIVYHAETLGLAISGDVFKLYGYRSPHINEIEYDENDVIKQVTANYSGIKQIKTLNPYETVEAETIAWNSGVSVKNAETAENCTCTNMKITDLRDGDWTAVSKADFGDKGADSFKVWLNSENKGHIEIRLDSFNGELVGEIDVEPTDGYEVLTCKTDKITDVHDVYLVFRGEADNLFDVDKWCFIQENTTEISAENEIGNGNINVNITATGAIDDKTITVAFYDANNILTACRVIPAENVQSNTASISIEDDEQIKYAKVFVWDTLESMNFQSKAVKTMIR